MRIMGEMAIIFPFFGLRRGKNDSFGIVWHLYSKTFVFCLFVCLSVQWAFLFFWLNWGSAHALISATKWFEIEIPGHDRLSGITKIVINLNWHLHHTHTRSQRRFRSIFTLVNESTKSTVKTTMGIAGSFVQNAIRLSERHARDPHSHLPRKIEQQQKK